MQARQWRPRHSEGVCKYVELAKAEDDEEVHALKERVLKEAFDPEQTPARADPFVAAKQKAAAQGAAMAGAEDMDGAASAGNPLMHHTCPRPTSGAWHPISGIRHVAGPRRGAPRDGGAVPAAQ